MSPVNPLRHLARLTFVAFLLTFIASRTLVILIMARKLPDLFLHLGGTHVHHLNYGIFLLSAVAGVLLFAPLNQAQPDQPSDETRCQEPSRVGSAARVLSRHQPATQPQQH